PFSFAYASLPGRMKQVERMRRMQAITLSRGSPGDERPWSISFRNRGSARAKAIKRAYFFCSRLTTARSLYRYCQRPALSLPMACSLDEADRLIATSVQAGGSL